MRQSQPYISVTHTQTTTKPSSAYHHLLTLNHASLWKKEAWCTAQTHAIKLQTKHKAGEKTVHSFAQNGCTVARFVSSPTYTNCNLDYFHSEYILEVQNNPHKHTALPLRSKTKKKASFIKCSNKSKEGRMYIRCTKSYFSTWHALTATLPSFWPSQGLKSKKLTPTITWQLLLNYLWFN